jgi:cobalt/nickel transport system ATP-binding protein
MEKIIFALSNVSFAYLGRYTALQEITCQISRGQKIALLGTNGSGKSTFLHLLDGLIFPHKGKVVAFDRELREENFQDQGFLRFFRSKVGLVFQNSDTQLFCPTVKEDICFGPLQLGVSPEETSRRLKQVSGFLKIENLLSRAPFQLSIGEKRKVAIASTLAIEPEVFLLDEPTAGLDHRTSRQIIDLLIDLNNAGRTIITATHDLHIIEEIADWVFVFSPEKRIIKIERPSLLLKDRAFLEENNLLHIHAHRHEEILHSHLHQHVDHHH